MKRTNARNGISSGELAERAGVGKQTVRYYERRGLLPEPPRTESGYRLYSEDDLRRLRFIRTAQDVGFTLDEIADLLSLRVRSEESPEATERRIRRALERVERRLDELGAMKEALEDLMRAARGAEATDPCPILAAVGNDDKG